MQGAQKTKLPQKSMNQLKKWANELKRAFLKEEIQIVKKHKKCSTYLAIKEMQIEMLANMWGKEPSYIVQCKLVQPLWKTVRRLLKKLKIELLYDPAIPLQGIYPKECKSRYNKDTGTPMGLFIFMFIFIFNFILLQHCSQ
jgi:hypothetical protein